MSEKQFEILSNKLDTLIKLTAMNALRDKNLTEQVRILSQIDLPNKEIASILGTSPEVVGVLKARLKKRKTGEGAEETPKAEQKQVSEESENP